MSHKGNGTMGRFRVEIELANHEDLILSAAGVIPKAQVRRTRIKGVVDSGAVRLVLPGLVAKELGLPDRGIVGVKYADRRRANRQKVGNVWLKLQGRDGVFSAIVYNGYHSMGEIFFFYLITGVINTVIGLGYFGYLESSRGQTLGKQVLKLRTYGPDGQSSVAGANRELGSA